MIDAKYQLLRTTGPLRLATVLVLGLALPGCGGPRTMRSTAPQLKQLKITPLNSDIALGRRVQFSAAAIFSDGSSKDETKSAVWTSSNAGVASIDATGHATSLSVGTSIISASVNKVASSVSLTVSKAAMVAIAVTPSACSLALGTSTQLKASGTFTDQTTRDVTDIVTWVTSDPSIAAVSSTGLATSRSTGNVSIEASTGSVNASSQLTVTSAALVTISVSPDRLTVPAGTAAQFKAQGAYTDGSTRDLTSAVSWSSSPQGVVNVNSSGQVTGLKVGEAVIDASLLGVTGLSTLTVSAAQLSSITVSSSRLTIPLGATQQMIATGAYTDGSTHDLTNSVFWFSSSGKIVSISNSGVAGASAVGETVISATTSAISGDTTVTVSPPALSSIDISPSSPAVLLGRSLQLTAIGLFTDGSSLDLTNSATWAVDNASIASVNANGFATAQHVGSTGTEAAFGGIQGAATIVVEPVAFTGYFSATPKEPDATLRVANPGSDEPNLCGMVYVFDQDQQMTECCGCQISRDGLLTLSLNRDLIGNPLTGRASTSGSFLVVPADYVSNPSCNASSINPTGTVIVWATNLQTPSPKSSSVTEESFAETPLNATLVSALQAQCRAVQELGGGQGICDCGSGH